MRAWRDANAFRHLLQCTTLICNHYPHACFIHMKGYSEDCSGQAKESNTQTPTVGLLVEGVCVCVCVCVCVYVVLASLETEKTIKVKDCPYVITCLSRVHASYHSDAGTCKYIYFIFQVFILPSD